LSTHDLALNLDDKCLLIGGKVRKLTFGRQNWLYYGKWSAIKCQTKNPGNSFLREVLMPKCLNGSQMEKMKKLANIFRFPDIKVFIKGVTLHFFILYSALFHLPPLRFHCVRGGWDRTLDSCYFGTGSITTRLKIVLIHSSTSRKR
jgi:hypothetical protein